MSTPTVLISIINWNNAEVTLKCVAQLQQQDYPHKQIVVIDNASQPHSLTQLRADLPDDVHLIESPENAGYAGGHRLAVDYAQAQGVDCFWLLNTDIILPPDTLRQLVGAYELAGENAILGGIPLEYAPDIALHDKRVLFHRKYFSETYRELLFVPNTLAHFGDLFSTMNPRPVAALAGSCLLIPLAVIENHGFMDTDFFMYSEEVDYCFRLRQAGVTCIAVPNAYLFHESAGASRDHKRLHSVILYYQLRNQLVRIKRYQSWWDVGRAVLKNLILIASYPLLQGRVGFEKARFGLRATWHGLQGKLGKTYAPEDYLE